MARTREECGEKFAAISLIAQADLHFTLFSPSMDNRPSSGGRDGAVRSAVVVRANPVGPTASTHLED
jgi:hypothetical protein